MVIREREHEKIEQVPPSFEAREKTLAEIMQEQLEEAARDKANFKEKSQDPEFDQPTKTRMELLDEESEKAYERLFKAYEKLEPIELSRISLEELAQISRQHEKNLSKAFELGDVKQMEKFKKRKLEQIDNQITRLYNLLRDYVAEERVSEDVIQELIDNASKQVADRLAENPKIDVKYPTRIVSRLRKLKEILSNKDWGKIKEGIEDMMIEEQEREKDELESGL